MGEKLWHAAMKCGRLICHQKPERSFFIRGHQFPVCARCTGISIGFAAAVICLWAGIRCPFSLSAVFVLLMFVDWLLQFLHVKESNNIRRLVTGIPGGFGLSFLSYQAVMLLHDQIVQAGP